MYVGGMEEFEHGGMIAKAGEGGGWITRGAATWLSYIGSIEAGIIRPDGLARVQSAKPPHRNGVDAGLLKKQGVMMSSERFIRGAAVAALFSIVATASFTTIGQELKKPSPIAPLAEVYFEDEFEGDKLAGHWEVTNPDPDQFVVENGALLIIGKAVGGLTNVETPNLFRLKKELPQGDWVVTVRLNAELQTAKDLFEFGPFTDAENLIATRLYGQDRCCPKSNLYFQVRKIAGGQVTFFQNDVWKGGDYMEFANTIPQPITLKLIKEGRTYRSAIHFDGQKNETGDPIWIETDLVSSLRPPKQLVLNASQYEETSGESLFLIDSVKIETP